MKYVEYPDRSCVRRVAQVVRTLLAGAMAAASMMVSASALAGPSPATWATESAPKDADAPQVRRLGNGMRYVILPRQSTASQDAERVSFRMRVDGGWIGESKGEKGLAHLIEHMALEGTRGVSATEIAAMRDRLTVASEWGAWTSPQASEYFLTARTKDIASLDRLMAFFHGIATDMTFTNPGLDRQRQIVTNEMAVRAGSNLRFHQRVHVFAPGSALDLADAYRSPDVTTASTETIDQLYQRLYRPQNVMITIVGDVDPAEIDALIRKYFDSWAVASPAGASQGVPPTPELAENRRVPLSFDRSPSGPPIVLINAVARTEPGDIALDHRRNGRIAERLLVTIVNQRFAISALRTGSGQVRFSAYEEPNVFRTIQWEGQPVGADWQAMLKTMLAELALLKAHGIDDRELAIAKKRVLRDLAGDRDRRNFATNSQTAERLTADIANGFVSPSAETDYQQDVQAVATANIDQVNAAWRTLIQTAPIQIRVESNALASVANPSAAIAKIVRRQDRQDRAIANLPAHVLSDQLAYRPGTAGAVAADKTSPEGVRSVRFANGITLNLVRRNHQGKWLEIAIELNAPVARAKLDYCDAQALPTLFEAGGSRLQSAAAMREAISATDIRFDPFRTTQAGIAANASALNEDIRSAILLYYAALSDPGFRAEGTAAAHAQLLSASSASRGDRVSTLLNAVDQASAAARHGHDAPFDAACIKRSTMARSRALLGKIISDGDLQIAVAGNFDEDQMIALFAATFGTMSPRPRLSAPLPTGQWTPPMRVTATADDPANPQTAYAMFWPIGIAPDVHALAVQRMFVTAFSRLLYRRWTEQDDLSYAPRVHLSDLPDWPGSAILFAGSEISKSRQDALATAAREVATGMAQTLIDPELLELVRRLELDGLRSSFDEDRVWAYQAAQAGRKQGAVREWRDLERALPTVTAEEVTSYAKHVFSRPPVASTFSDLGRSGVFGVARKN